MSDPFDPVEHWLGADIELLPPQPGAFDRIHHRARRRKTVVALSTAAGAAVAIAAAATLPQLVSLIGPGHGGTQAKFPAASSSNSPRGNHSPSHAPKPHQSSSVTQPAQSNLTIGGSTQPPTPGIEPSSVTFVSGTIGAVIGETTYRCPSGCEAVAATSNYGQTWRKVDPPPAGPPNGDSGVSQIRFLEKDNGWVFGPELYATHTGGATWTKINGLPGRVIDLATVGGTAYAVVASCTGTGADYAGGCTSFRLYSSPYDVDNWQPVPDASGKYPRPGGLQLNGGYGYLLAGHVLFTGRSGGGPWEPLVRSSGLVPSCWSAKARPVAGGTTGLIAIGAGQQVYLFCQPAGDGTGTLYHLVQVGSAWQVFGQVKVSGTGTSLAVAPGSGTLVLGTSTGIYYSPDARHWYRAGLSGQAPPGGFSFVGMTTQQNGVAVPARPGSSVIYVTIDGGQTWHAKRIA